MASKIINTKVLKEWGRQFNLMRFVIYGVIIVLFVGFAGVFVAVGSVLQNYLANKQATYQNLVNQVNAQNTQIQLLTQEVRQLRQEQSQVPCNIELSCPK